MKVSLDSLKLALALAVFMVFVVMAMQFESLVHPFVILLTVPLGAIGVIAGYYGSVVDTVAMRFMDILLAFPSCTPPIDRLLEHLPRLLPRPMSLASYVDASNGYADFVFNVVLSICGGQRASGHR